MTTVIAAFDFDETLITKDSLFDFLAYSFPRPLFYWRALLFIPTFLRFKMGRVSRDQGKQRLLSLFLRNMPEETFHKLCAAYAVRIRQIENSDAIRRLQWHHDQKHEAVVISASIEDWIRPWAHERGIDTVLATRLERRNGRLTGALKGKNCFGPEKVLRFKAAYPKRADYQLYMYGDGKSDQDMFAYADAVFEQKFE